MSYAKELLKEKLASFRMVQESNLDVLKRNPNAICVIGTGKSKEEITYKDLADNFAKKIEDIEIALKVLELFEVVDDVKLNINE